MISTQQMLRQALANHQAGNRPDAIRAYKQVRLQDPDN